MFISEVAEMPGPQKSFRKNQQGTNHDGETDWHAIRVGLHKWLSRNQAEAGSMPRCIAASCAAGGDLENLVPLYRANGYHVGTLGGV